MHFFGGSEAVIFNNPYNKQSDNKNAHAAVVNAQQVWRQNTFIQKKVKIAQKMIFLTNKLCLDD